MVMPAAMPDRELLKFPAAYPIKVIGRRSAALRSRIDDVVRRHVEDMSSVIVTERDSARGNFVAISYRFVARSKEQVVALTSELAAHEDVIMLI
jgi:putative lipoic acid-binding regulatory protein